mgnify:CR=1 FL=1
MSLQKIAEYLFPAGNFAQIRANAPDRATYNIGATRDLVQNQPAFIAPFAPAAAATMSLPYDLIQASQRARDTFFNANPTSFGIGDDTEVPIGPSFSDLTRAVAAENPLDSLVQRTQGATLGLADKLQNIPEFLSNLVFTPIEAEPDITNLPNIDITDQLDDYYEKGEMMDNVVDAPKSGILDNINFGKLLSLAEILGPTNLRKALVGTRLGDTVSNLFQAGRNRSNFQYRTPGYTGQLIASDQYDPITKTNRFDRAKTLFGKSRTLMDYIQKKKEQRARRAANRARVEQAIQNQQDAGGSVQTSDSYSGIGDVGATGANFSGDFATDSASYDL